MPPQTRSRLQIPLTPMGSLSPSVVDGYDESSACILRQKESGDWDERYGAPIRPPVNEDVHNLFCDARCYANSDKTQVQHRASQNKPPPTNPSHDRLISSKRKFVSMAVQTSPIEEVCPPLCRDNGSSSGSSPDPESDEEGHPNKNGLKRAGSTTSSQTVKKAKVVKPSASPTKVTGARQPRRDTIITLDGASPKPRSIYAPSPTPLQCSYVYPRALGPPRRPMDLRRNKGAKPMPDIPMFPELAPKGPADPNTPSAPTDGAETQAEGAPMEVDDSYAITHRCPITFSREFEMRRHIRTVHIAEEVRAVVEGRLARSDAKVIPDNWDGKTLISKPTCAGCSTTFSRPDAVRRHQTEVNAKMENGICIECPGPKVHIRRGPRKDIHLPTPDASPVPPTLAPALGPAFTMPMNVGIGAGTHVPIAPAPATAPLSIPVGSQVPAPTLAQVQVPIPGIVPVAPAAPVAVVPSLPSAPVLPGAGVSSDAAPAPAVVAPQPQPAARDHAEPAEVEPESEDECN
ncbi:unnamed protein product [Rhizoctonia solani]|uniref:Uncharacterized protein n=1 Tax=Rhizoctonia solani TaxID=456999 RepID=A0A8H2WV59_9AGAM|nr:unnamed protein product [Rhizoctonia solani]